MNHPNRDLLLLFNQELMSPRAIQHEVDQLHDLLYSVEAVDNLLPVYEGFDLNKRKIIHKPSLLRPLISESDTKPFVFLNCVN
ncbi:MAG: hypothetical protein NTX08_00505 [Sphingobacteriales bacterium]|jgi:hypothetical protein|nr:hypothetical protein [Sphingobacteriales bacterium]